MQTRLTYPRLHWILIMYFILEGCVLCIGEHYAASGTSFRQRGGTTKKEMCTAFYLEAKACASQTPCNVFIFRTHSIDSVQCCLADILNIYLWNFHHFFYQMDRLYIEIGTWPSRAAAEYCSQSLSKDLCCVRSQQRPGLPSFNDGKAIQIAVYINLVAWMECENLIRHLYIVFEL